MFILISCQKALQKASSGQVKEIKSLIRFELFDLSLKWLFLGYMINKMLYIPEVKWSHRSLSSYLSTMLRYKNLLLLVKWNKFNSFSYTYCHGLWLWLGHHVPGHVWYVLHYLIVGRLQSLIFLQNLDYFNWVSGKKWYKQLQFVWWTCTVCINDDFAISSLKNTSLPLIP